jgi:hypothetical protein
MTDDDGQTWCHGDAMAGSPKGNGDGAPVADFRLGVDKRGPELTGNLAVMVSGLGRSSSLRTAVRVFLYPTAASGSCCGGRLTSRSKKNGGSTFRWCST